LALACPHLPKDLAQRARDRARIELSACIQAEALPLSAGRRRELYEVPPHDLSWSYHPRWPAIGHVHAIWLYGERTGDCPAVEAPWPKRQDVWSRYAAQPLAADPRQGGHLYLNRTAAGCLAYARLAHRFRAEEDAAAATRELDRLLSLMLSNYRSRAAVAEATLQ